MILIEINTRGPQHANSNRVVNYYSKLVDNDAFSLNICVITVFVKRNTDIEKHIDVCLK